MEQAGRSASLTRPRHRFKAWITFVLCVLVVLAAGAALIARQRSLQLELKQAQAEYRAKRYGLARQRLARLAERSPNDGEVLLLLGNCEFAAGKRRRRPVDMVEGPTVQPVLWPCRGSESRSNDRYRSVSACRRPLA